MTEAIEPFALHVPDAAVDDLRRRVRAARLPERETASAKGGAASWEQGAPLEVVRELLDHWATTYDWRRVESQLNAGGLSTTNVDGLDIHFLHVRSSRADATPLVVTHGWPSSLIEPLQVVRELADPPSADQPAFHVVAPALPGFGFGGKPAAPGWGVERTADAWAQIMTRLGYERFFAAGGDWGGRVTTSLAVRFVDRVLGLHTFTPYVAEPAGDGDLSSRDARWVSEAREFWRSGSGYSLEQSTRPQTVGYALTDSPVAQLTWILEKMHFWTDRDGANVSALDRDQILDTVSFYWFSASGGSSARFYWENFPPEQRENVEVPTAVSVFPADIEKLPRSWVERRFRNIRSWNETERGGHFPMLEVPEIYVRELRAGLASLLS